MEPSIASATWLFGKLRDWAAGAALDKLKSTIDPLQAKLDLFNQHAIDADQKSDDQLVAPMREGIRRWQFGDWDGAVDRFHQAEGHNPLAPMPRILLALARMGDDTSVSASRMVIIAQLLAGAARLNPYALVPFVGSEAQAMLRRLLQEEESPSSDAWAPWIRDLDSPSVIQDIAGRCQWRKVPFWRTIDPSYRPRSTSAIRRASMCGEFAAIEWLVADHLMNEVETAIVLFRLDSGTAQWGHLGTHVDLQFLTYQHVVVRESDDRFALLGLQTGKPETRFSRRYFDAMFGDASATAMFAGSNWQGLSPAEAFTASTVGTIIQRGDPAGHRSIAVPEGKPLIDPVGLHSHVFTPANRWEHEHFVPSGGNLAPYCHLRGGAHVACR